MNWTHLSVSLAALSLASYAWAAAPEARLGAPVALPGGSAQTGETAPDLAQALAGESAGAVVRYARALAALQPEAQAATRGATETRVYQQAAPAVVLIVADDAIGSGVLIGADGKIVTNLHVVGDAEEVGVIFKPALEGAAFSKNDVRRAQVLRRDEVADLALIQVAEVPTGVKPLALGNSTTVQVGDDVHAIGHPTGQSWTYTKGIVSQVRRAYAWTTEAGVPHEATVIQTQTPINPGNSGGPLLDDELNVLGVNSFVSEGEGLNFAVSAEDVKSFLARSGDRVSHAAQNAGAESECEIPVLAEERQETRKRLQQLLDLDCDGQSDAILTTPDTEREPVTLLADEDGDGEFDTMYFDDDHDGEADMAWYDTDGNGKPDLRGEFRDGEDEPYRWEKMEEM